VKEKKNGNISMTHEEYRNFRLYYGVLKKEKEEPTEKKSK